MDYGKLQVKVRGIKYRIDYEDFMTFATSEYGVRRQLSPHKLTDISSLKDRIKYAWSLKPYREDKG